MSGSGLLFYSFLIIAIAYSASSLSSEAELTMVLITELSEAMNINFCEKIDFIFHMTRVRTRNVNIQNFIFVINWKITLSVR